ncbi:MAG: hypothetical protein U5L45_15835 [Saprospiraceae bacterium]|nr:hypothetical protein [Saprospiraceae bacterium]
MTGKKLAFLGITGALLAWFLSDDAEEPKKEVDMNKNSGIPDSKKTKGISFAVFNRNPLNVKVRLDANKMVRLTYPGEISTQGAQHMMFDTWENGTAGSIIHLWRYMNGKVTGDAYPRGTKLNTIEKIISTWAPKSDRQNDTEGYIRYVVVNLGLFRDSVIPFEAGYIKALVAVMAKREDGKAAKLVTPSVLDKAWEVADDYLKNV